MFRGIKVGTDLDLKPGDIYQDKGFLSVTTNPAMAQKLFAEEDGMVIAIQIPPGTPGIVPDRAGVITMQSEAILNRDTKIVIDDVQGRAVTARVVTN